MDDETKAFLEAVDDETKAFLEAMEARLMARMNDQHERLIERINSLARDFQNTKGFLIKESLMLGQRTTSVEDRLDDLERGA
jgi:putative heme iron utilization protein